MKRLHAAKLFNVGRLLEPPSAADNGKSVYATDGQTLTCTAPTAGLPFGFIVKWISSTTCDVYFYSFAESLSSSVVLGNIPIPR